MIRSNLCGARARDVVPVYRVQHPVWVKPAVRLER